MNDKALWYLTRGSGIVSLILLTVAVLAGIVTSTRWVRPRWPRFVMEGLHRNVSLLSTVFVFVHIASAVLDGYVSIRWVDAVVPFRAAYKPLWLGLGALSLDVFLALAVTSLLRARLGYRTWRSVHWLAYGCWGLALVHGLGVGSDRKQAWMLVLDLLAVVAVTGATAWRTLPVLRRRFAGGRRPSPLDELEGAFR
jgi:methionine sulfoxide reductase heme-binding subunit